MSCLNKERAGFMLGSSGNDTSPDLFGFHCVCFSDCLLIMAPDFIEHYGVPDTMLGTGDTAGNKTDQNPCPPGADVLLVQKILAVGIAHGFQIPTLPLTSFVSWGK